MTRPLYLRNRRYWRYFPLWRWWFTWLSRFERCRSCGQRRGHTDQCYFA